MKIFLFIAGIAMALGFAQSASAQSVTPQDPSPEASLLDKRFNLCLHNSLCTVQDQLQIVHDMDDNMRDALKKITQTCITLNYKNCIGPQMGTVAQWHRMQDHMRDMMQAMELQYASAKGSTVGQNTKTRLNMIEPAAGLAPDPYTKPDQTQLERQKRQWWRDWMPANENNPYHKW